MIKRTAAVSDRPFFSCYIVVHAVLLFSSKMHECSEYLLYKRLSRKVFCQRIILF